MYIINRKWRRRCAEAQRKSGSCLLVGLGRNYFHFLTLVISRGVESRHSRRNILNIEWCVRNALCLPCPPFLRVSNRNTPKKVIYKINPVAIFPTKHFFITQKQKGWVILLFKHIEIVHRCNERLPFLLQHFAKLSDNRNISAPGFIYIYAYFSVCVKFCCSLCFCVIIKKYTKVCWDF